MNITEFKKVAKEPVTGGGDSGAPADALIIEKVDNGYILRCIRGGAEEGLVEECLVFLDRSELMKDIAGRI